LSYRQSSLGTRYLPGQALIPLHSHIQRSSQGLEESFRAMVIVCTGQQPGVQIEPTGVGQTLQEVGNERRTHLPNPVGTELTVEHKVTASAKIDGNQSQRFIHWDNGMSHPGNPSPVIQRFSQRPAQHNADIFNRMVFVNVQITPGADVQVKARVSSQGVQHVIQKADTGLDISLTGTVQVETDIYIGFTRFAGNSSLASRISQGLTPLDCWGDLK
jgi:hypothetical protein